MPRNAPPMLAVIIPGLLSAVLMMVIFLAGCGQQDPTRPLTGMIFVFSDSSGAAIYLDGENSGQVTPDTLKDVPNGSHVVRVRLTGFVSSPESLAVEVSGGQLSQAVFALSPLAGSRKIVLLEHFTSVNCGPCPTANAIINAILTSLGPETVLGIEYHPWPADPFYNDAPVDNLARSNYYGVTSVPHLFVDGMASPQPTDSAAIAGAVLDRLDADAPVAITVSDTVVGQSWAGTAEIVGIHNIASSDLRGYFVVLEREVNYATPPGTNGERDFYYVMRKILPDASGEVLNIAAGGTVIVQEETDLHPDVDPTRVYAVFFIQDYLSREIYQAGTSLPAMRHR